MGAGHNCPILPPCLTVMWWCDMSVHIIILIVGVNSVRIYDRSEVGVFITCLCVLLVGSRGGPGLALFAPATLSSTNLCVFLVAIL